MSGSRCRLSFAKATRGWFLANALYDSVEDGDIRRIVQLLREKKANPNILLPEFGVTPFHIVIGNECQLFSVEATKLFLRYGADPNSRSDDGMTPVMVAATWGRNSVLSQLLAYGGNPRLKDCDGMDAFDFAHLAGHWETLEMLELWQSDKAQSVASCKRDELPNPQQPKYTLQLDQVIMFKDDMQLAFKALPNVCSVHTATQTSITDVPIYEKHSDKTADALINGSVKSYGLHDSEFDWCGERNGEGLDEHTMQTILNHRNKTTIYQYCPEDKCGDSCTVHMQDKDICCVKPSGTANSTDSIQLQLLIELQEKLGAVPARKLLSCDSPILQHSLKTSDAEHETLTNDSPQPFSRLQNGFVPEVRDRMTTESVANTNAQKMEGLSKSNDDTVSWKADNSDVVQCRNIGFVVGENTKNSLPEAGVETYLMCQERLNSNLKPEDGLYSDISSTFGSLNADVGNIGFILTSDESCASKLDWNESDVQIVLPADMFSEDEAGSPDTSKMKPEEWTAGHSCSQTISEEHSSPHQYETCFDNTVNESHNKKKISASSDNSYLSCPVEPKTETKVGELKCEGSQTSGALFKSLVHSVTKPCGKTDKSVLKKPAENHGEDIFTNAPENQESEGGRKLEWTEVTDLSLTEEYLYTDTELGIHLIERRYLLDDVRLSQDVSRNSCNQDKSSSSDNDRSSCFTDYDTDTLRVQLKTHGFDAGPITCPSIKRVYLRKLRQCRRDIIRRSCMPENAPVSLTPVAPVSTVYSNELMRSLAPGTAGLGLLMKWAHLEREMSAPFAQPDPTRRWRGGTAKTSFTYLLLDPRSSTNLPARAVSLEPCAVWAEFLRAIFYVGKGKGARPYDHLYEAVAHWRKIGRMVRRDAASKKVGHIIAVWDCGLGVVCLHVFHHVTQAEAYTREAAMIDALSLPRLANLRLGDYYATAASWDLRNRRRLGAVLLYRALQIGELEVRSLERTQGFVELMTAAFCKL